MVRARKGLKDYQHYRKSRTIRTIHRKRKTNSTHSLWINQIQTIPRFIKSTKECILCEVFRFTIHWLLEISHKLGSVNETMRSKCSIKLSWFNGMLSFLEYFRWLCFGVLCYIFLFSSLLLLICYIVICVVYFVNETF